VTTTVLCELDDLVEGAARHFDAEGLGLAVVRIGDEVICMIDRCSHEDFPLSEGEVLCDTKEIECARHGALFDLTTGEPSSLPATKPVAIYEVAVRDGKVEVVLP
jgi:3-phenylpropionate/trans-cinnamate dioxygenase ferredoxin subunit